MERSSKEQEDLRAQDELWGLLDGGRPLHVTLVAAACLRAVDAAALNAMLAEPEQCRRFRQIRQGAQQILQAAGGAKNIVYADTLAALGAIVPRHERADDAVSAYRSLGARALAQALHDTREHEFWSYFSDWNEARKLAPGDPVPVPTLVKLHEIYRLPLRLSPCPDTRDTPHGLCPGGYGGLPSLRLMPACPDGDVYLDPSLDRELCPIATGDTASAAAAVVVPAEHLDQRYDYDSFTVQDERVFSRVRPRGAADGVDKLIDDVIANLRRAGDHAALVVLPELTSTPELEDAIGELLVRGELGKTQLVVAGSSWIPAGDAESAPGDNRSTSFPRGSDPPPLQVLLVSPQGGRCGVPRASPQADYDPGRPQADVHHADLQGRAGDLAPQGLAGAARPTRGGSVVQRGRGCLPALRDGHRRSGLGNRGAREHPAGSWRQTEYGRWSDQQPACAMASPAGCPRFLFQ